jgi:hypothetical protein
MERETRRLEGLGQLGFAFVAEMSEQQGRTDETDQNDLFLDPEPCGLFVGSQKLEVRCIPEGDRSGLRAQLAALLAELDLSALTCRYRLNGRKAFHPRTLLGADRLRDFKPASQTPDSAAQIDAGRSRGRRNGGGCGGQ